MKKSLQRHIRQEGLTQLTWPSRLGVQSHGLTTRHLPLWTEAAEQQPRTGLIPRKRPQKRINDYGLGFWNARLLSKSGATKDLLQQASKYKVRVLAVQETNWSDCGITDMRSHRIFKSGKLSGNLESSRTWPQMLSILNPYMNDCVHFTSKQSYLIYGPIEEKYDEVKEQFYDSLERQYDSLLPNDVKIMLGDLNAKVRNEGTYRGTTGGCNLHDISNDNNQRLIDFRTSRNLVINSTCCPVKRIHIRWYYLQPDRQHSHYQKMVVQHPWREILSKNKLWLRSLYGNPLRKYDVR